MTERFQLGLRCLGLALACCFCTLAGAAESLDLWSKGVFEATAAEILSAAEAIPVAEDAWVDILFEEGHYSFDEDGRSNRHHRLVYRILSASAIESWGNASIGWKPWQQTRPQLKVRVITPDGEEHWLDPATIAEQASEQNSDLVFSDRRELRAPLPAVRVGAIIEKLTVSTDDPNWPTSGSGGGWQVGYRLPVHSTRLVLDAPKDLPLRWRTYSLPDLEPQTEKKDGRQRWIFEAGPLEALKPVAPFLPADVPTRPAIRFSTGESWNDIAKTYAATVDQQIDGSGLGATARKITRDAKSRHEKAVALLAWVQEQVRYTGVEFAEAAVVPRSPKETLERKYGDCKDKAALLVALLRSVKIPSHVALLRVGSNWDVEPELPHMGGFDHAIVYLPGEPGIWIDPTVEYARVGELPVGDQGRLALIASAETSGLTLTPTAEAEENRSVEQREVTLASMKTGTVVESSQYWGHLELELRDAFGPIATDEVQEQLESYGKSQYASESIVDSSTSDAKDLSITFETYLVAQKAQVAVTDIVEAAVGIHPSGLVTRLPDLLLTPEEDKEDETGEEDNAPVPLSERVEDLLLPLAYSQEWQYRIVPPPGFVPSELPESEVLEFGPATFVRSFAADDNNVINATFRFDTGKRRLTAEEAVALRDGVVEIQGEDTTIIRFEQKGEILLGSGQIREALEEFRRLAEQQPEKALPRTRVARALLDAGLGDAARREAQVATEIEPELGLAHQVLGVALSHDLLGRMHHRGFDLEGAEAAFRKGIEIDPGNHQTIANLAILLELDEDGWRYSPQARLGEAISTYQQLREEEVDTWTPNLLISLVRAQRFEEAEELARELASSPGRQAQLIASITARKGSGAAIREISRKINEDQRYQALTAAANTLLYMRFYPEAAEILTAAAEGQAEAVQLLGQAARVRKMQRIDAFPVKETDPKHPILKMALATVQQDGEALKSTYHPWVRSSPSTDDQVETILASGAQVSAAAKNNGGSKKVLEDAVLSNLEIALEGDEAFGFRARTESGSGSRIRRDVVFLAPENDQQFVLAYGAGDMSPLGRKALEHLDAGELEIARQWLDWAREETPKLGADDPLLRSPFAHIWKIGQNANPEEIRTAALILMATGTEAGLAVAGLEERLQASDESQPKFPIELALALAHLNLENAEGLLEAITPLHQANIRSEVGFLLRVGALYDLQRNDDAKALAEERLAELPKDERALLSLADAHKRSGKYAEASELYRQLIGTGNSNSLAYNNLAWNDVVLNQVTDSTLELALQAVQQDQQAETTSLHTLAAVFAEADRPQEARQVLLRAMAVGGYDLPRSEDWYVLGRIAESYGEIEAARDAYQKVELTEAEKENDEIDPESCYALAQRHLNQLAVPASTETR